MDFRKTICASFVIFLCMVWLSGPVCASAQKVGSVLIARGMVTAQGTDGELRILGKEMPLFEKDVVTTGDKSFCIIRLNDESRLTLRPDTTFAIEEFAHGQEKESVLLRLFRGGIRALAGLIAKRNPNKGYQLSTPTAVMGVRGTEFDARLCEKNCAAEDEKSQSAPLAPESPVAGRVVGMEGLLTAWNKTGQIRRVFMGGPVYEKELLETGEESYAVIVFRDGSRITLQENTKFKLQEYFYQQRQENSIFFRLMRGGVRTLAGWIAKLNPTKFKVRGPTAVVGVRGTGFDMFLCKDPCDEEPTRRTDGQEAVGRIFTIAGQVIALGLSNEERRLVEGSAVYEGDLLESSADGMAVVVFLDNSRVTLQNNTQFKIDKYRYGKAEEDSAFWRFFRGGVRVVTGWMAKRRYNALKVETPTAVVGIRGTGVDLICSGKCIDSAPGQTEASSLKLGDGMYVYVWDGEIELINDAGAFRLGQDEVLFLSSRQSKPVYLPEVPPFLLDNPNPRPDFDIDLERLIEVDEASAQNLYLNVWDGVVVLTPDEGNPLEIIKDQRAYLPGEANTAVLIPDLPVFIREIPGPRPDGIPVDMDRLFSVEARTENPPGLYVSVHDGHVTLENASGSLELGKGEAGYADLFGQELFRLVQPPPFMIHDRYPRPWSYDESSREIIRLFEEKIGEEGKQEGYECEIR